MQARQFGMMMNNKNMKHQMKCAIGVYSEKSIERLINGDGVYSHCRDIATPDQDKIGKTYFFIKDSRDQSIVIDRESAMLLYGFLENHLSER
jgi:hypothetical protein